MCVPDLLGTQGTFLLFTTRPASGRFKEGGLRVPITERDGRIDAVVTGPDNGFVAGTPALEAPFSLLLALVLVAHASPPGSSPAHAARSSRVNALVMLGSSSTSKMVLLGTGEGPVPLSVEA